MIRNAIKDSISNTLCLNSLNFGKSGRRKFPIIYCNGNVLLNVVANSKNVSFLKSTGVKNAKVFIKDSPYIDEFALAQHDTSPIKVNWNKDGVPNLLIGAKDGHFYDMLNSKIKKK